MTDLEDLNRTLYDIGAQDLLDVWEAMEAQVRKTFWQLRIFKRKDEYVGHFEQVSSSVHGKSH